MIKNRTFNKNISCKMIKWKKKYNVSNSKNRKKSQKKK